MRKMNPLWSLLLLLPLAGTTAHAAAANAFHIPWQDGGEANLGGAQMRQPGFEIGTDTVVKVISGYQKWSDFQGGNVIANQTNAVLWYKAQTNSAWQNEAMTFFSNAGLNQYWDADLDMADWPPADVIEYYMELQFDGDGSNPADTTFIYGNDGGSSVSTNRADAEADPSSIRNRAAFIFHGNERIVIGNSVTFGCKIGYITENETRWVDQGRLYYTTNGVNPEGALGVAGNGSTMVATMNFDTVVIDFSPAGQGMKFSAIVTNLPLTDTIKYKMGFWHSDNNEEKFASYRAGANDEIFSFQIATPGDVFLTVNGVNAEYTTTKFFVNERSNDSARIDVEFNLQGVSNVIPSTVEVFANVGRRALVNTDWDGTNGIDAIRQPNFNQVTVGNFASGPNGQPSYYRPHPMQHQGAGIYTWGTNLTECGAYRLSARFQTTDDPGKWQWYPAYYQGNGYAFPEAQQLARSHAIVLSPTKALDMTLYELHTITVEATNATQEGRSTFNDLLGAADGDTDGYDPFNLAHLDFLQANCLWFQPIHPNGEDSRTLAEGYFPGSPYATRDYFAVSKWMSEAGTEAAAMAEFTNFVAKADHHTGTMGTINIMLDYVANHTSWDAVMGQGGVDLGLVASPSDSIGVNRAYWYSDGGNIGFGGGPGEGFDNYCDECDGYTDPFNNDIAFAPDRGDFGKWQDVADFYFGRYSALVCLNDADNSQYLDETDAVDYDSVTLGVRELWEYISYYPEFWIKQTGHPGNNNDPSKDDLGVDAFRCDFGQGLPPQLWEYIINHTRNVKWNAVFMAETLDGGSPGYRSNRHFDILNENLVFQFTQAKINEPNILRNQLEDRRNGYNGAAILLNLTSHDEIMPDNDPWLVISRYASLSAVDGLPMMFYGQEKGIGNHDENDPNWKGDGFSKHEKNFGKYVPHFKDWNKLTVWDDPPDNAVGLDVLYGRINAARLNYPSLRSQNRFFLSNTGGNPSDKIFAVAKYDVPGALTNGGEVVLAFANFFEHGGSKFAQQDTFSLAGPFDILGLDTNKTYNIRNLASSDPGAYIWSPAKKGDELLNSGIFVRLGGDQDGPITNDGHVVQYLKLEEVGSANSAPVIDLPGPHTVPVGGTTNFTVTITDADPDPVTTNVTIPAGATYLGTTFMWMPDETSAESNDLVFVADDQQAEPNSVVTGRTHILVPFDFDGDQMSDRWEYGNFNTLTNPPTGDVDGDGSDNASEEAAGTDPNSTSSVFIVTSGVLSGPGARDITIPTVSGRTYRVQFADGVYGDDLSWQDFANPANGVWVETSPIPSSHTFTDDEGPDTTGGAPAGGERTYRVLVSP